MNVKRFAHTLIATTIIGLASQSHATEKNSPDPNRWADIEHQQEMGGESRRELIELMRRRANGLPGDETKTPVSPDVVEHEWNFLVGGRLFGNKRIYFGIDESGKPCYLRIRYHAANNPEFSKVQAIIYHEAGKFARETFENVGPVRHNRRFNRRLENAIGSGWFSESKGGLWCPQQNVFIGGTRETGRPTFDGIPQRNMCEEYERFLLRPQPMSKLSK